MLRIAQLALILLPLAWTQRNPVSTASDYVRVREILKEFYKRSANAYGHDYDPDAVQSDVVSQPCTANNEVCANKKYWGDLFENDIVLTLPQAENLLAQTNARGKRQAQPYPDSFWRQLVIPYVFGFQDSSWHALIRQAHRHIESETCIRFSENAPASDRLMYIRGSGCWSNVGRIGGTQQVSIGYGCDSMGIIAHETLHALGLWHEQSRTDRDSHIFINPSAIIRGTEGNFQKRTPDTSDNMGQPYDLGSVMHYSAKSFTNNYNVPTIQTRDARFQRTIGQREAISFKDAKMINLRYCDRQCNQKLSCANGGYTDPNNCGRCKCPSGYAGTYCTDIVRTNCGGELAASPSQQSLISGNVYAGSNCVWRIRSPAGQKIELSVDKLSFICRETCTSYVEIKYNKDKETVGARLCCEQQKTVILSESDEVIIIFRGEEGLPNGYNGFELKYKYYGSAATTVAPPTPTTVTTTTTPSPTTTTRRPVTTTPYWYTANPAQTPARTTGASASSVSSPATIVGKPRGKAAVTLQPFVILTTTNKPTTTAVVTTKIKKGTIKSRVKTKEEKRRIREKKNRKRRLHKKTRLGKKGRRYHRRREDSLDEDDSEYDEEDSDEDQDQDQDEKEEDSVETTTIDDYEYPDPTLTTPAPAPPLPEPEPDRKPEPVFAKLAPEVEVEENVVETVRPRYVTPTTTEGPGVGAGIGAGNEMVPEGFEEQIERAIVTFPTSSYGSWSLWSEWSRCSEPCGGCGRRRRVRACSGGEGNCVGYPSQTQPCNSHVCIGGKSGHICNGRVLIPCELASKLRFVTTQKDSAPALPPLTLPTLPPLRLPASALLPIPRDNAPIVPPGTVVHPLYGYGYPSNIRRRRAAYPESAFADSPLGSSLATLTTHTGPTTQSQNSGPLCEKRFSYYCPLRLLTIHIDWLTASDAIPAHHDSPRCCTGYYASEGKCYKNE